MPRVTQYIRDEDLEAWQAIPNKSEWIHEHLQEKNVIVINRPEDVAKVVERVAKEPMKFCKEGHPLKDNGRCFGKGCKYA